MKHYFWGVFLISTGIFLLIKHYLNLNVSSVRIIIGLFIVCLGLSILVGGFNTSGSNRIIFGSGKLYADEVHKEYNIIFSQGVIDLSNITDDSIKNIEINTVFGDTELILPDDRRVIIKAHAAFASTSFPNGGTLTFGEREYSNRSEESDKPDLNIEVNTVFGRTSIK